MKRTFKRGLAIFVSVLLSLAIFACTGIKIGNSSQNSGSEKDERTGGEASLGKNGNSDESDNEDYDDDYSEPGEGDSVKIVSNDGTFYGEWLDDGQCGIKYQGSDGYIIAIFNADGILDHFKEFDNSGDLQWSCDWYFYDERDQEHSFCIGYEHSEVIDGKTSYYDSIFADYDLDYCLEWPNEYYENDGLFAERNQQYVTVDSGTFTLWWRSMIYLDEYTYYYEFEDRNFSFSESSGKVPSL